MSGITLGKLLESGEGSDLKLIVGLSQEVFNVHRLIVSFRSDFFKGALQSNFKESADGVINLPGQKPITISHVLNYLYTGDYTSESMLEDQAVWIAADFLGIEGLGATAMTKLGEKVNSADFAQFDKTSVKSAPQDYPHPEVLEVLNKIYEGTGPGTRDAIGRDILQKILDKIVIRLHILFDIYDFKDFFGT